MALRLDTTALVVVATLTAVTIATGLFWREADEPVDVSGPDDPPAAAADANQENVLGCVGQTAPNAFSLAVSRVLPDDPLRIETYGLIGSEGLSLSDHIGHTIQVAGTFEEAGEAFPRLRVASARYVAASCWRP